MDLEIDLELNTTIESELSAALKLEEGTQAAVDRLITKHSPPTLKEWRGDNKHKHELNSLAICVADCDLSRVTIP